MVTVPLKHLIYDIRSANTRAPNFDQLLAPGRPLPWTTTDRVYYRGSKPSTEIEKPHQLVLGNRPLWTTRPAGNAPWSVVTVTTPDSFLPSSFRWEPVAFRQKVTGRLQTARTRRARAKLI